MAEGGSNDGGDDDDADGSIDKWKVGCESEEDDDAGDDNDNGGVNEDGRVDINDGNDANGGDSMSKAHCDDDTDGGGGYSNDDGCVDGNGTFGKRCVDGKSGVDVDDGDEQTESVAGDLAECNGSSEMEMIVGVMR